MSITKTKNTTARASQITIDKTDPDNTMVHFKYVDEEGTHLAIRRVPLAEIIADGFATGENVTTIEDIMRPLANEYSPYNT